MKIKSTLAKYFAIFPLILILSAGSLSAKDKVSPDQLAAETAARIAADAVLQSQIDTIELTPGPQGETGEQGPAGPSGADGAQGPAGADGAPGPAGADGADGADGATGQDGMDGAPGATGEDGMDGAPGPTGPQGIPGISNVGAGSAQGDILEWNATGEGEGNWVATVPATMTDSHDPGPNSNYQPYTAVNYIIATQGIFPSRNSADPFLAEIIMFAGNFAPRGWALCDGQLLSIAQNNALFALLGTTYGGDGRTTFGLPDLRGRAPVHVGTGPGLSPISLGQKGGTQDISAHDHDLQ